MRLSQPTKKAGSSPIAHTDPKTIAATLKNTFKLSSFH